MEQEQDPQPKATQKAVDKASQKAAKLALEKAESKDRVKKCSDASKSKIIEFVRANSALYDLSNPDYKDPAKRAALWAKIGGQVALSEDEVKTVWNSLREIYGKTKKRAVGNSGASLEEVTVKWKFFESMRFLDSCPDVRQTSTTIKLALKEPAEQSSSNSSAEEITADDKELKNFVMNTPKSVAKRQRVSDPLEQAALDFFTRPRQPKERTEDDVLAELLVVKMKNMDVTVKSALQQRILQLLAEHEVTLHSYDLPGSQPLNTQMQQLGTFNYNDHRPESHESSASGTSYIEPASPYNNFHGYR